MYIEIRKIVGKLNRLIKHKFMSVYSESYKIKH